MIYGYKCRTCGAKFDSTKRFSVICPHCLSTTVQRDYTTVQIGVSPFQPHYNHAVGAYVSSSREFDDMLKIRGDESHTTLGRIDPGEAPDPPSDTEILETQARTIRDNNINPADLV